MCVMSCFQIREAINVCTKLDGKFFNGNDSLHEFKAFNRINSTILYFNVELSNPSFLSNKLVPRNLRYFVLVKQALQCVCFHDLVLFHQLPKREELTFDLISFLYKLRYLRCVLQFLTKIFIFKPHPQHTFIEIFSEICMCRVLENP